jgi:hypothetical protein
MALVPPLLSNSSLCGTGLPSRKGEKPHGKGCTKRKFSVPDIEAGCCQGPEGNGVSSGEGGERGPGPPGGGKDKQSVLSKGMDNMDKDEEDRTRRT